MDQDEREECRRRPRPRRCRPYTSSCRDIRADRYPGDQQAVWQHETHQQGIGQKGDRHVTQGGIKPHRRPMDEKQVAQPADGNHLTHGKWPAGRRAGPGWPAMAATPRARQPLAASRADAAENQPAEKNQGNDDLIALELRQVFADEHQLNRHGGDTRGHHYPSRTPPSPNLLQNIEPGRPAPSGPLPAIGRRAVRLSCTGGRETVPARAAAPRPGVKRWRWRVLFDDHAVDAGSQPGQQVVGIGIGQRNRLGKHTHLDLHRIQLLLPQWAKIEGRERRRSAHCPAPRTRWSAVADRLPMQPRSWSSIFKVTKVPQQA
jgi:hypothetical protein